MLHRLPEEQKRMVYTGKYFEMFSFRSIAQFFAVSCATKLRACSRFSLSVGRCRRAPFLAMCHRCRMFERNLFATLERPSLWSRPLSSKTIFCLWKLGCGLAIITIVSARFTRAKRTDSFYQLAGWCFFATFETDIQTCTYH